MKKILLIFICLWANWCFCQLNVLECYQQLPIGTDNPIRQRGANYETTGTMQQKITVTVDKRNGFLEWFDMGLTTGVIHVQLAKFNCADGKSIVVYKKSFNSGNITELYLQTFVNQKDTLIEVFNVFPNITMNTFLNTALPNVSKEQDVNGLRQLNWDVQLPQQGTSIVGRLRPEILRDLCKTSKGQEACRILKNVRYIKIIFAFERSTGKFNISTRS